MWPNHSKSQVHPSSNVAQIMFSQPNPNSLCIINLYIHPQLILEPHFSKYHQSISPQICIYNYIWIVPPKDKNIYLHLGLTIYYRHTHRVIYIWIYTYTYYVYIYILYIYYIIYIMLYVYIYICNTISTFKAQRHFARIGCVRTALTSSDPNRKAAQLGDPAIVFLGLMPNLHSKSIAEWEHIFGYIYIYWVFGISFDIIWYHLISFDIIWYHLISFDIIWSFDLIAFDVQTLVFITILVVNIAGFCGGSWNPPQGSWVGHECCGRSMYWSCLRTVGLLIFQPCFGHSTPQKIETSDPT